MGWGRQRFRIKLLQKGTFFSASLGLKAVSLKCLIVITSVMIELRMLMTMKSVIMVQTTIITMMIPMPEVHPQWGSDPLSASLLKAPSLRSSRCHPVKSTLKLSTSTKVNGIALRFTFETQMHSSFH